MCVFAPSFTSLFERLCPLSHNKIKIHISSVNLSTLDFEPERISQIPGSVSSLATTNPPAPPDSSLLLFLCDSVWGSRLEAAPYVWLQSLAAPRLPPSHVDTVSFSSRYIHVSVACGSRSSSSLRLLHRTVPLSQADLPADKSSDTFRKKTRELPWSRARLWAVWTSAAWPAPCRWSRTRSWRTCTTWAEGASAPCSRRSTRTGGPRWPSSAWSSTVPLEKGTCVSVRTSMNYLGQTARVTETKQSVKGGDGASSPELVYFCNQMWGLNQMCPWWRCFIEDSITVFLQLRKETCIDVFK